MENLNNFILDLEALPYSGNVRCIEALDNLLQDILLMLAREKLNASGEILELKNCTWVLHERYHMDTPADLKFTFHHTKHRMLKSCLSLLERYQRKIGHSGESNLMAIEWNGTAA